MIAFIYYPQAGHCLWKASNLLRLFKGLDDKKKFDNLLNQQDFPCMGSFLDKGNQEAAEVHNMFDAWKIFISKETSWDPGLGESRGTDRKYRIVMVIIQDCLQPLALGHVTSCIVHLVQWKKFSAALWLLNLWYYPQMVSSPSRQFNISVFHTKFCINHPKHQNGKYWGSICLASSRWGGI